VTKAGPNQVSAKFWALRQSVLNWMLLKSESSSSFGKIRIEIENPTPLKRLKNVIQTKKKFNSNILKIILIILKITTFINDFNYIIIYYQE
jgi:hypothetical protein